ncbi:GEVED domain-containing protein [Prosthecobacter sp.]|uniref:GEVED domain-containing protein n=1 Tax=Prosthecobacter sp. TaxID=1965333 RepID=UPI002AB964CC|nr:GEVED domain-containing protein [Prosthecobacter sp.]MDZ4405378.1 GEVED domain-containing protein [Prosthecobacter sp.]
MRENTSRTDAPACRLPAGRFVASLCGALAAVLMTSGVAQAQTSDFGDFSLFSSASSTVVTTLKIGATTDKESAATTNATATGDDLTGSDDEDGVTVPVTIARGVSGSLVVNVTNTTGSTTYLNVWIDWNNNGNITSAGSQIATNVTVASGTSNSNRTLNFTVPSNATLGAVGVRVRLTSVSSPGTDGADGNGEVEDHLLTIIPETDFGDYGLFASATQVANSNIRIGTNATDTEASNPSTGTATADDTTGVDDEDLTMPALTAGTSTMLAIPVTVNAASLSGSTARINVFADWNGDNDVVDTNETLSAQTVNISGTYNFTLTPPAGITAGTKYLRIRISESSTAPIFSGASTLKGEVEDYAIVVGTADFGDHASFPSASSTVNSTLKIGSTTDAEITATTNATATGDDTTNLDDENGVTVPASVVLGVAGSLTVNVTNTIGSTTYLNAWIDFNGNGVLTDSGEQIATNTTVASGTSNSNRTVNFTVPATATPGVAGVRVRLTSTSTPGPDGADGSGEVEDYVMTLACPTVTISPTTPAVPGVGTAYSQSLTASGSTTTFTYDVTSGALPAGLSLDENTGVLSGTPTSSAAASFTVTATGANGCTGSRAYTVTPVCPTISLTPTTVPDAYMGSAYSQTLTASGGTAPYTYTVTSGTLPTGLSLSTGGVLSGTPTTSNGAGVSVTIRATDTYGCQFSRSYVVQVCPVITVNPASAASAVVGTSYPQTMSGSGGAAPYTFAVTSGALPSWATLNPSTGVISGTPNSTTSATFTIRAVDANGCQGTREYTITPACPTITVNPATLPDGVAGFAYNQTLSGGTGTMPYTFAVTSGALPAGLSLNTSTGAITGTPVNGTAATFTVRATDNYGCTGTRSYTIAPVNIEFGDWNGSGAATASASTIRNTNIRLGATVDAEAATTTNAAATTDDLAGTDDEDGVAIPAYLTQGANVTILVNVFNNNAAGRYLQGWIDFNNDGTFNNTDVASGGERIYNAAVPASASSQTLNVILTVPAGASAGTQRGARFRFTDNAATTPTSSGANGETEDYAVTIASPPATGNLGLPIVQEWFVPQPEAQIREDYLVLAPKVNAIADSVITVTVPIAATKIVFDHWEDGYEMDLKNPVQPGTLIWGDGNNANGKPPGYANDPASFTAGSVITMRNNVPLPRNASAILYDGRDRLGSTYGIVMTRAAWFTDPGPLLANSVEVRALNDWGKTFVLPVGEDIIYPSPLSSSMFEHCAAYIMAAENGTTVQIDKDANGTVETTVTLNKGESYLINSGIKKGAAITTSKPAQVIEFFGDINANFETRGANVPPREKWSSEYYAPVGTAADGDDTHVFLYNPDTAAITVNYATQTGSGSFSIPAKSTYRYLMPQNSGARFTSVGSKPFWGLGTVGAEANQNNVHDWAYALVPKDFLSTEVVVGWGAGSDDGSQNGSPIWVTPTKSTTIYVDYNGDRNGPLTDPSGQKYDLALNASLLSVNRIYESDKDQSGTRLYTLDGTQIIGAWGQDPAVAGPARPFLDLGNTLPNYPAPLLSKVSNIVLDTAPAGYSIGDVLEYTVTLENKTLFALTAISIVDTLPNAKLTYVRYSTIRDGMAVTESGTTPFPLDESGLVIPILNPKESTVIKFRATITASGTISNSVSAAGYPGLAATDVVEVIPGGGSSSVCTLDFTNNVGTSVSYQPGDGIHATVNDNDANTATAAVETITAHITNTNTGDVETITLTETGPNTGIFRNTTPLPTSTTAGLGTADGTLNVQVGVVVTGTYTNGVTGETGMDTTTIVSPSLFKQLYLDADGANGDMTGDLDRIDPVVTGDSTTSETATLAPGGVSAIVAAATTSGSSGSVASGGTLSFSHTPGSGDNRLLLVAISVGNTTANDADPAPGTVTGVTFGGTAMTQVAAAYSGAAVRTYIYRLINPSSSAANVVVSIGSTASSVIASATTFTGVHQTTPLGSSSNYAANGSDYFVSGTFASATDELVYSSVAVDEYSSVNQGVSSASGQTQLWNNSGFNYVSGASSTKPGAASVSLRYDILDYEDAVMAAVSIKPAADAAGSGATWTQTPAFAENFSMPAGGNLGVTAYAEFPPAVLPATPAITATLKNGGVTIASLDSPNATLVSGSGGQPVTLDATSTSQKRAGTGTGTSPTFSSHTWAHTTGTGSNRLLLVGVAIESDIQSTLVNSVTYSGQSLVKVGSQQSAEGEARMEIWRLVNPPSGTANVVVTLNQACDDAVVTVASTFSGVHQSTPLGTFASAQSDQGDSAPAPSLTLVSASGELVFDVLALDDADTITAPGSGQTQRMKLTQADSDSGITGAASTKAGASSVSMSWTTSPDSWALGAVSIKPATTGTSIYRLDWNTVLASAVNLVSGQSLSLTIANAGEADFSVLYDSSTYPSKVSLPTNTVIHTDSIAVYDAPYPGGTATTAPNLGEKVYVRVTVGDPFGAYDITTVPFTIDAPGSASDVSATLTVANVVETTAATKTYQYVWTAGSLEGPVTISATAKEGYENTITSSKSAIVTLSSLDLGTLGFAVFTTGSNGTETTTFALNEQVAVRVTDIDQNINITVAETLLATITSSSGDSEQVTLTETGIDTGVFVYSIPASSTVAGSSNNGTLYVPAGAVLTVSYVDPTDSTDTSNATATVPAIMPDVSVIQTLLSPADGQIIVGEAAQYRIRVTNTGNTTLNTVQVVDTFPAASLSYVSASATPTTVASGSLTWTNVGPLNSGQSVDLIVNFTGLAAANPALNTVNVTTSGGPTASSSVPVIVTRPAVTVTKTLVSPNPGPASKGDDVVFNLTLQNTGTTTLTTLPLEDTFSDANFDYVFATITPDAFGAGSLVWNDVTDVGSLAVGETFTVTVTLRAKGNANPASNTVAVTNAFDANGDPVPSSSSSASLQLLAATISGSVYEDIGTVGFGGGDTALENVTITLYSDPDADGDPADGSVQAFTTTDETGYYEFLNLGAGDYVIVQDNLPTFVNVADTGGANDNRIPVNVTMLISYPNNNFLDVIPIPLDFGDWNGSGAATTTASTILTTNIRLGEIVDEEESVTPDADATADGNDEDGVIMPASMTHGTNVVIPVSVFNLNTANRYLQAWIDLNNDGTFNNTDVASGGERIYNAAVPASASLQTVNINFAVPMNASVGPQRGVRFRFTDNAATTPVSSGAKGETEDYVVAFLAPTQDFGDFSGFASVSSTANSALKIGALTDLEGAQTTNSAATGDDTTGVDDEDGVTMPASIVAGGLITVPVNVTNNTGAAAYLNAWIDYNNNGSASDVGEQIATNVLVSDGTTGATINVTFDVPTSASVGGGRGARFRLTSTATPGPTGTNGMGEVEDYVVSIAAPTLDYADFNLFSSATSVANNRLRIGALVDVEGQAATNAAATGDDTNGSDDEDGVTVPASITQGTATSLTVNVTNTIGSTAYLNAWIDFNGNGVLTDAGEQVASNTTVASGTSNSNRTVGFTVPAIVKVGTAGVRVRLTSTSSPGPDGQDGSGEVEDYTTTIVANTDFGDLATFPSASSKTNNTLRIGSLTDSEGGLDTNANATTDDLNGSDDEDGVTIPASIAQGAAGSLTVNLTNTSGSTAYLNAWIDFNRNGVLTDAGEQVAVNTAIVTGTSNASSAINFTAPVAASLGTAGIRVRLTSVTTPGVDGLDGNGEVEDHTATIVIPTTDFGDELDLANASSTISTNLRLGALVDAEGSPSKTANADGDDITGSDDEDGLSFPSVTAGQPVTLPVTVSNTSGAEAYLNAWIDFNNNGVLTDAGEQVATNVIVSDGTTNDTLNLNFNIPTNAVTAATSLGTRFRLTDIQNPGPTGQAGQGEVEDHPIVILAPLTDFGDFSGAPEVSNTASTNLRLGTLVDTEYASTRNASATGDDTNGVDDEDGVTLPSMTAGAPATITTVVTNNTGSTAYLNAWIDFNNNGVFNDSGEQVANNGSITTGTSNASRSINLTVPPTAVTGTNLAVRVRISNDLSPGSTSAGGVGEVEDYVINIAAPTTDFGDFASFSSASSTAASGLRLGTLIDTEYTATINAAASGDDTIAQDDEDGVVFPAMTAGAPASIPVQVTNVTGTNAYLNAWIDFNNNGSIADAGEQIATNVLIVSGTNNVTQNLNFTVPAASLTGVNLGARFRFTSTTSPGVSGSSGNGEVEDHLVTILAPTTDFGDFSGFADASQGVNPALHIGTLLDPEFVSIRNATATGDDTAGVDDEDGVAVPSMIAGQTVTIPVTMTNETGANGFLNAWIDFNNNGVLTDSGEQVATNIIVPTGTTDGVTNLTVTVPATTVTGTNLGLRFRLSAPSGLGPTGTNPLAGEIEDYAVAIAAPTTDFGDHSNLAAASSTRNASLLIGATVDTEFAATTNATAMGDDTTGLDDEDGVVVPASIDPGSSATLPLTVQNNSGANAWLHAWIDFNNDGVLNNATLGSGGERLEAARLISPMNTGTILREYWTGISGSSVVNLTSNGNYPNTPTGYDYRTNFTAPVDWADNMGQRMRGWIYPPVSGEYTFWVSGDDETQLFLSTDETTANAALIARVLVWTGSLEWTKYSEQKSVKITLEAGKPYYIEALMKEGGGGDSLAAAWELPGTSTGPVVIAGQYLAPWSVNPPFKSAQQVTFTVPVTANPGANRAVRFRLTNSSSTGPTGASGSGEVEDYAVVIASATNDFGDWSGAASAANGVSSNLFLGTLVDAEYLAATNATATGDDNADTDDEDGVTLPSLTAGGTFNVPVTVTNLTGSAAYLHAWIDFNNNGVFTDSGEQFISNLVVAAGSNGLALNPSITVPTTAVTGTNIGVRFRLTTTGTPGATGNAGGAGEVEDYVASIAAPTTDQGDHSRFAAASSTASNSLRMGTLVDAEYTALTNVAATGDDTTGVDDEDGVTLPSLMAGAPVSIPVVVTNNSGVAAYLNAWIDFNNNGVLTDAGEQVATNVVVATGTANSTRNLAFTVPPAALTGVSLGVRVRLTSLSTPGPTGLDGTGEVEDYVTTISPPPLDYGDWSGLADASSTIDPGLRLGTLADTEFASTRNSTASGDDNTELDDEDGVVLPTMTAGAPATIPVVVTNTTAAPAYLNAWFDFNNNGSVADAGEQIATNLLVASGTTAATINLNLTIPANAITGASLGTRFRLTSILSPGATGNSGLGEVEDYPATISVPVTDYGDLSGVADASNIASSDLRMGALADTEYLPTTNAAATGDDTIGSDDEDGVTLPVLMPGTASSAVVVVTNNSGSPGYLNGWIDFNNNGSFTDAGEQIATNLVIANGTNGDSQNIAFNIPVNAIPGTRGARFRLTTLQDPTSFGAGGTGEVEDHLSMISCVPFNISPASLLASTVGTAWSQTLTTAGIHSPFVFNVTSGALPAGLALDSATGVISGTPTSSATVSFTVTATDANGCTGSRDYTMAPACPVISITPASLTQGTVGTAYSRTLTASGGTAPYSSWTVISGALPAGLSLNAGSGIISGTPSAAANPATSITVRVTDTYGCQGTQTISLQICPVITLSPAGLASSTVGTAYSQTVSASGSITPYTFAVSSGSLPVGLTLNPGTGVISGTPTTSNTATFTLRATDAHGCSGTRNYTLTPACPVLTLVPSTLPAAYLGGAYNQTLTTSNGTAPYSYFLQTGALPTGLSLSSTGIIAGVPSVTGSFAFTIRATDAYGCFSTLDYILVVRTLSLGNLVFEDSNNNGVKDTGEPGLEGALVQLFATGDDNAIGGTGTAADLQTGGDILTPASGTYLFTSVPPGKYYVKVTPPADYTLTGGTAATTDDDIDNNNDGAQPGGSGTALFSPVITLTGAAESITDGDTDTDTNLTLDFGLWSSVAVGNFIFLDINGDGVRNEGESLGNIFVELYAQGATPGVDEPVSVGSSGCSCKGRYYLEDLNPGSYFLHIPASQFVTGMPLEGLQPMSAVVAGDDDAGQDLVFNNDPAVNGASTAVFTLRPGLCPVGAAESGGEGSLDDDIDARVDLTRDLGVVAPAGSGFAAGERARRYIVTDGFTATVLPGATTFATWAQDSALGGATDDPDEDGLANLLEYALGTDPVNALQPNRFTLTQDSAGSIIALLTQPIATRDDIIIKLESLTDLTQAADPAAWKRVSIAATTTFNGDDTLTRQYANLEKLLVFKGLDTGFIRLKIELDANRDGVPEAAVASNTHAWSRQSFASGTRTFSMPLLKLAVFTGRVSSVSANEIVLPYIPTLPSGSHYLEVIDGTLAGQRFEIDAAASSGNTLVLHDAAPSFAALTNARIIVRPHHTLGELLAPAVFTAEDRVLFFDNATNNFTTLTHSGDAWLKNVLSMNSRPFAAHEAVLVQVRGSGTVLTFTGEVRPNSFTTALTTGTQLIAPGWPTSLAAPVTGLRSGAAPETADRLRLWNGDTAPESSGYTSYYLDNSTTPPSWQSQTGEPSAAPLQNAFQGLFLIRETSLMLNQGAPW